MVQLIIYTLKQQMIKMKKLIIILSLASSSCYSQVIGIKFNNPKTFTVRPSITTVTDSIVLSHIVDDGFSVKVDIKFYVPSCHICPTLENFVVWAGSDYIENQNWNKSAVKQRIKDLLNQ